MTGRIASETVGRGSGEDEMTDLGKSVLNVSPGNPRNPAVARKPRLVAWFSCGTPSAVASKLLHGQYGATHEIAVARIIVPEEHEDNDRFAAEISEWCGAPIVNLRSAEYESCQDVWTRTRYMAGVAGARCTTEMKRAVRWAFEREWRPDLQAFGYTVDEAGRASDFRENNPEVSLLTPLIDAGLTRQDCHAIINRAGIAVPEMYRLGYNNNNCIGCVKAQSPVYWLRVKRTHPDVFAARSELSRELGARLVKLGAGDRPRIFLDELTPDMAMPGEAEPAMECSLLCYIAEQSLATERRVSDRTTSNTDAAQATTPSGTPIAGDGR